MNKQIAQIVVGLPVEGPFDYMIPEGMRESITEGMRVRIVFNRKRMVGFVIGFKEKSEFKKLNSIISLLEDIPALDEGALELCRKVSRYYGCSLGEAIEMYLPPAIRKGSFAQIAAARKAIVKEQKAAYGKNKPTLFYGLEEKELWLDLKEKITRHLNEENQIVLLVPEMSDIPPLTKKIRGFFKGFIAVFDKKQTAKKELELWLGIKAGKIPIVIGTRSAVFSPVSSGGLMIVFDEENDAYKQEQIPHYHAREVALMRHGIEEMEVVFSTKAPTAELWYRFKQEKWLLKEMSKQASNQMQLVDMGNYNPRKSSLISFPVQNEIESCLSQGKKVLLFMNRRGFFTLTKCNQCGQEIKCPRCDVNLTYLYPKKQLVCRHCNFSQELPKICPACQGNYLRSMGRGIEKLESSLARMYPQARIARLDKENVAAFKSADIIIGTLAVMKIKDSFSADMICLLNFDAEMNRLDYRCANKAFSLLMQLRAWAADKIIIQAGILENYCLKNVASLNFNSFYEEELAIRKELMLPPFSCMVSIIFRGEKEDSVKKQAEEVFAQMQGSASAELLISDPVPDVNPKIRDKYRFNIILRGPILSDMLQLIKKAIKDCKKKRGVVVSVNVDP